MLRLKIELAERRHSFKAHTKNNTNEARYMLKCTLFYMSSKLTTYTTLYTDFIFTVAAVTIYNDSTMIEQRKVDCALLNRQIKLHTTSGNRIPS